MKKIIVIACMAILCANYSYAKKEKSAEDDQKKVDKEEAAYQKNLRKNPQMAITYWEHANNLVGFKTEFRRAGEFYDMALQKDSLNAAIYKDYGKYLSGILYELDSAKFIYAKGLKLAPEDQEMKTGLQKATASIDAKHADELLKDFGHTTVKTLSQQSDTLPRVNIDSLKGLTAQPGNDMFYPRLLNKFFTDENSLSPEEMFFLIIGYSNQASYSPFNYNEILALKVAASRNIDTGIAHGTELANINPLNPTLNRELMYYYRKKNDAASAQKYLNRIHQFFNGILYSGNGTCDKPYIALWGKEEYNFLNYLNFKTTDNKSMSTCNGQMVEVIESVNNNSGKSEAIHFNMRLIYLQTMGK